MKVEGKKLGLLVAAGPGTPGFHQALQLALVAQAKGVRVFCYFLDEAVSGLEDPRVQQLQSSGARLLACAFGAQKRGITLREDLVFAGLSMLADIAASTDRFVCFS